MMIVLNLTDLHASKTHRADTEQIEKKGPHMSVATLHQ